MGKLFSDMLQKKLKNLVIWAEKENYLVSCSPIIRSIIEELQHHLVVDFKYEQIVIKNLIAKHIDNLSTYSIKEIIKLLYLLEKIS